MIYLQTFTFNAFGENTYVIHNDAKEAMIIDPGCYDAVEKQELSNYIEKNLLKVVLLINTHCHIDHVLGNEYIKDTYKVQLGIPPLEEPVLRSVISYAGSYGFPMYRNVEADYFIEGDSISLGEEVFKIYFVPGHSPGHLAFYHEKQKICIAGDVLFRQSIGRADLPGGDYDILIKSIHNQLFTLPNDVIVYPGHGPETSIGFEKKNNPFCAIR